MRLAHRLTLLGGALLMLLYPVRGNAEQAKEFGAYIVHYNALPSEQITPEVAKSYGIVRSKNRGLLNVAVLKKQAAGEPQAAAAKVSARVTNLAGQNLSLVMREVKEQEAIYYLAEFMVSGVDTVKFSVSVDSGDGPPMNFEFSQAFYVD